MKPAIVCLCGSSRFKKEFSEANKLESLKGKIVLSIADFNVNLLTEEQKNQLDVLHKYKIDLADEILFIDVDEYIGPSTTSELEYAKRLNKYIRFWSKETK